MKPETPAVALIIPGGIGTGKNNMGVPVLERITRLISKECDVTVFQLFKVNEGYTVEGFQLIDIYSRYPIIKIIKFLFAFWKIHRQKGFQTVHGFWLLPGGFLGVIVGKLFGIKSVVSVLGGDAVSLPEINYGQLRNPVYRRLTFWTLHHADEVNALTQYLAMNLQKAGFNGRDLKIIPWGIESALFKYTKKNIVMPIQFLHIANLSAVKDQDSLLRAFKKISEHTSAQLTIIGTGDNEEQVRLLIDELELHQTVTILPQFSYQALPEQYHRADVLLHTSLSEGQCLVVTEAMSCGVLVCGTKVGLIFDLPECCVSVPVKDWQALAAEVLVLLNDEVKMESIRHSALKWTREHDLEWTKNQYLNIYKAS